MPVRFRQDVQGLLRKEQVTRFFRQGPRLRATLPVSAKMLRSVRASVLPACPLKLQSVSPNHKLTVQRFYPSSHTGIQGERHGVARVSGQDLSYYYFCECPD